MSIEFPCPHCSQLLRVGDENAGKTAKCPKCEGLAKIPARSEAAPLVDPVSSPFANETFPIPGSPTADANTGLSEERNPFSDFGASGGSSSGGAKRGFETSPGEINPYSSPAPTFDAPYRNEAGTGRTGLPWELRMSLGSWWETLTMILGASGDAFRRMYLKGGYGGPIFYAFIGLTIGSLGNLVFNLGFLGLVDGGARWQMGGRQVGIQIVEQVVVALVTPLLVATVVCLIQAAITHACLLLMGGEKNGFEATFRVCAYTAGVFGAFNAVPLVGPCVAFVWQIICTIIGLMEVHETSVGKAAAAYIIQLVVLLVLCLAGAFAIAALAATLFEGM